VTFTLAPDDSSNALTYFAVSQVDNEGSIWVRQDLRLDRPQVLYSMRLLASDGSNTVSVPVSGKSYSDIISTVILIYITVTLSST